MSEELQQNDWTELILEPGKDWRIKKRNTPVVKVTFPNGNTTLGVLGSRILHQGEPVITHINFEVSENEAPWCLSGDILIAELKEGKIGLKSGENAEVEFVGLASDPSFEDKNWSYW